MMRAALHLDGRRTHIVSVAGAELCRMSLLRSSV